MEVKIRKRKIIHKTEQHLLQSWDASIEETANRWLKALRVRNKDLYLCILYKFNKKEMQNNNKIKKQCLDETSNMLGDISDGQVMAVLLTTRMTSSV
jgi:hypothetical protein